MVTFRFDFEIIWIVVRLIFVNMMHIFTRNQKTVKFVLHKNDMKWIQPLGVTPWVRRLGPAIAIATAFADGEYAKHILDIGCVMITSSAELPDCSTAAPVCGYYLMRRLSTMAMRRNLAPDT
jgi:hypothetical protein